MLLLKEICHSMIKGYSIDKKMKNYMACVPVTVYHKSLPLILNQQGESNTSPENLFHQKPMIAGTSLKEERLTVDF